MIQSLHESSGLDAAMRPAAAIGRPPSRRAPERALWPELSARQSRVVLSLLTVALLLPFAGKAFHIDDPLFVWTARHITAHPLDFYGFSVNWTGTSTPMAAETKNPPLAAFLLALVGSVGGWSELALHLGFVPVAVAAVLGTRALAERFCQRADLAAMVLLVTPAFLVSATTVMCDCLLLAFYVWAIHFFVRGLDRDRMSDLLVAGLLAALATLTKYFGATLVPLFLFYGLARRRKAGAWTLSLLIPIATLAAYEWLTLRLYHQGLFAEAAGYAVGPVRSGGLGGRTLTGLAFTGACFAPLLFFLRRLRWRYAFATMAATTLIGAFILVLAGKLGKASLVWADGPRWDLALQIALWAYTGAALLAMAVLDWRRRRDPDSTLLGLWIWGTFFFAALVNWTVNVRSVLPLIPAAAILLVRRLDDLPGKKPRRGWALWPDLRPLLAALALAVAVSVADLDLANSARRAAETIHTRFGDPPDSLWFEGHWGFQYSMQALGHTAFDARANDSIATGDRIAFGGTNTHLVRIQPEAVERTTELEFPLHVPLTTMNLEAGAGFYSDNFGPLPFVFASPPVERYKVLWVRR